MAKIKDVISRVGVYVGSNENNKVKKYNVRKILYFNHLNLYLHAPKLMADRYMKDGQITVVPKAADYPAYIDLSSLSDVVKDVSAVSAPGQAAYVACLGREHFDNLTQYAEEVESGRYYWELRGTETIGGIGKVLLHQGTQVNDTSVYLQYTREMDTTYADDTAGAGDDVEFDCPNELLEILIQMSARDALMEMGNKEGVKEMRALVDEQKGLLGQLDALRQTRSQVLRQGNLDS